MKCWERQYRLTSPPPDPFHHTIEATKSMDKLQPVSNLDPNDIPAGFTVADPNRPASASAASAAAAEGGDSAAAQKLAVLEQALTMEARARLRRIQLVKPDKAAAVESVIYNLAMSGKLPGPISEDKLIELLERKNNAPAATRDAQRASSISIQRKKYAMDSDDDDNDDDLL
jgi:programmed cell death protein 5